MSPARLLILFLLILVAAGSLLTGLQPSFWKLINLWVVDLSAALLWTVSGGGLGFAILRFILPKKQFGEPLSLVSYFALGLGALSLVVFIFGALGLLHPALFYTLAILPLLGWAKFPLDTVAIPRKISAAYIPLFVIVACALVAASLPPGLLWTQLGDPNSFDVLEYHLQIPREWHDMRRIVPLEHNVYSWFPFNHEMHYLAAMFLRGGPYNGLYTAQYLNLIHMILAALAIRAATNSKWPMMLFATLPWVFLLGTVAYNESGLLLYSALAIAWTLRKSGGWAQWIIAGAFAGLAAGTKYTAVPLLFIAWPVSLFVWKNRPKVRELAIYGLAGVLLFSPWMIRNIIQARNPVFPEAMGLFGRGPFTPQRQQRWENAHVAAAGERAPLQRLLAFNDQIVIDARYGFLLLPAAIACALIFRKHPHALPLLTFIALLSLFWLVFTHLQSRFFIVACIPAAMLICPGSQNPKTRWIAPLVCVVSPICLISLIAGMFNREPALKGFEISIGLIELEKINPQFPDNYAPGQSILLIGDSRALLYPIPSRLLHYKTVFNLDLKPGQEIKDAWYDDVKLNPGDKIVYDGPEIERLTKTYLSDK